MEMGHKNESWGLTNRFISRQVSGNVGRSHFNNTMVIETCVVKREWKEKRHQQSYCICFKCKENPQLLAEIIKREECDFSIGKRNAYCKQMGNPIEKTQWFQAESSWIQDPTHSQDLGWWWCTGDPLLAVSVLTYIKQFISDSQKIIWQLF